MLMMDPDQFVTPLLDQATISKLISLLNKSSGEVEKAKPRCLTGTQCIVLSYYLINVHLTLSTAVLYIYCTYKTTRSGDF